MKKHVLKHDRDAVWTISKSNAEWTLANEAEISIGPNDGLINYGIFEKFGTHGNTIRVNGDITVLGESSYGIWSEGQGTRLRIGARSEIFADTAILLTGPDANAVNRGKLTGDIGIFGSGGNDNGEIVNAGKIATSDYGILVYGDDVQVSNSGRIFSQSGVVVEGHSGQLTNNKQGLITGDTAVVVIGDSVNDAYTLVNKGTIQGGIAVGTSGLHLTNTGTIIGDIYLAGGADIINVRNGVFVGEINGGGGDDTYIVKDANTAVIEDANDGNDTVKSAGEHTLGENFENLVLPGKASVNGAGNGLNNVLTGNKAANHLFGFGGDDELNGGLGKDLLAGGAGADLFIFEKGSSADVIADFTDGVDHIRIANFTVIADFDALKNQFSEITENGVTSTLIDLGSDSLTLTGVMMAQLGADDFMIV